MSKVAAVIVPLLLLGCSSSAKSTGTPKPDAAAADAKAPETAVADVGVTDVAEPDATESDAEESDTLAPDTATEDVATPDVATVDTPEPEDLVPDVSNGCPDVAPTPNSICPSPLKCEYGIETCCGESHPSFVCSCNGLNSGTWACYYTDACLMPQCPDASDDAGGAPDIAPTGPSNLLAAGWSFGECMGACKGALTLEGATLDFPTTGNDGTPFHHAKGVLTTGAAAKMESLVLALEGVTLDPTYGCPDCADGGASYLTLELNGVTAKHAYEYGKPPAVLADLDALVTAAMTGLKTCTGDETVVVQGECPIPEP